VHDLPVGELDVVEVRPALDESDGAAPLPSEGPLLDLELSRLPPLPLPLPSPSLLGQPSLLHDAARLARRPLEPVAVRQLSAPKLGDADAEEGVKARRRLLPVALPVALGVALLSSLLCAARRRRWRASLIGARS